MQLANGGSAENDETDHSEREDIAEQYVLTWPQRQRRPPPCLQLPGKPTVATG